MTHIVYNLETTPCENIQTRFQTKRHNKMNFLPLMSDILLKKTKQKNRTTIRAVLWFCVGKPLVLIRKQFQSGLVLGSWTSWCKKVTTTKQILTTSETLKKANLFTRNLYGTPVFENEKQRVWRLLHLFSLLILLRSHCEPIIVHNFLRSV